MFTLFLFVAGLQFPVTLNGGKITTESTTKFTTIHRQVAFTTSDETIRSIRSTYRKSTYPLVSSSLPNIAQETHSRTTYSTKAGVTVYNSNYSS